MWTLAAVSLLLSSTAGAATSRSTKQDDKGTYVAPGVLQAAALNPNGTVRVIVQAKGDAKHAIKGFGYLKKELGLIGALVAEIPAKHLDRLTSQAGLTVTLDAPVKTSSFSASQLWPHQNGAARFWGSPVSPGPKPPAIAVIDSGIDKGVVSFGDGSRVVQRQVITTLPQDATRLDGRAHGTFVAGIVAGEAPGYAGVAPRADLVDLDVMDDRGMARTSDVVAALDWVVANKDVHNIRVVNLSLHSSSVLSIRHNPLNKAVQKAWFSGLVVVAAAGNYGIATGPSGVKHAPGNDPFVITVGAYDLEGSARLSNHDVPQWSAYGYTNEGFAKPDVVAAGRYLVAPVPLVSTMAAERPERVVGSGLLKLSGTSFAAPVVSGMAAQILARNPSWTPDMVKGAIMSSGRRMPDATILEQGRGEVNLVRAFAIASPVNPNQSLNRFVVSESGGSGRAFDADAWYSAMRADPSWDSAAWQDAAWSSAAWQDAAWGSAAWQDAAWQDAAWQDAAWQDSTSYEDNAEGETPGDEQIVDPVDEQELATDPELQIAGQ